MYQQKVSIVPRLGNLNKAGFRSNMYHYARRFCMIGVTEVADSCCTMSERSSSGGGAEGHEQDASSQSGPATPSSPPWRLSLVSSILPVAVTLPSERLCCWPLLSRSALSQDDLEPSAQMNEVICHARWLSSEHWRQGAAEKRWEEALRLCRQKVGENNTWTLCAMRGLAAAYSRREKHDDAMEMLANIAQVEAELRSADSPPQKESRLTSNASPRATTGPSPVRIGFPLHS